MNSNETCIGRIFRYELSAAFIIFNLCEDFFLDALVYSGCLDVFVVNGGTPPTCRVL